MKNLVGSKYGKITVLSFNKRNGKHYFWDCICECGQRKVIRSDRLNKIISCGCINNGRELFKEAWLSHGECNSPEYQAWEDMKARCYNVNNISYKNYGGRGIRVCARWLNSFDNFLGDIGRRPTNKHSLDRYINVNGDYEPSNCKWSTKAEQCRCRRNNVWLEHNGVRKILTDWATTFGVNYTALKGYIKRHNFEKAVLFYSNKQIK